MEVDVGGLVVSQYSLLGAHDPAWLTLLPLSSGATIHHDTGVGGQAKIQPAGAIHRDTAQWEIVRHNTVGLGKKRHGGGRAKDGSGLSRRGGRTRPPPPNTSSRQIGLGYFVLQVNQLHQQLCYFLHIF